MSHRAACGVFCLLVCAATVCANPIPWPPPASMPLEQMWIDIDDVGGAYEVEFRGHFTFNYIPADVTSMMFPIPDGSWAEAVEGPPGVPRPFTWADETYPTILPEMPSLRMVEWQGPFDEGGEVFGVAYNHYLIERPDEYVLFYSLGTGKYFPSYDKVTTAQFEITFPSSLVVRDVRLDTTLVDRSAYRISRPTMTMTIDSQFGPFTKDLVITFAPAGPIRGDCDGDGDVDLDDFVILKTYFGLRTGATTDTGDLDGDADVDLDDFVILKNDFGRTPVPEPGMLGLVLLGVAAFRRKRHPLFR